MKRSEYVWTFSLIAVITLAVSSVYLYSHISTVQTVSTSAEAQLQAEVMNNIRKAFAAGDCDDAIAAYPQLSVENQHDPEMLKIFGATHACAARNQAIRNHAADIESKKARSIAESLMVSNRIALASHVQDQMLLQGYDMTVIATGDKKDTLYVEYIQMNRPMVYQFTHNQDLLANVKDAGFKYVTLTNGSQSWKIQLS